MLAVNGEELGGKFLAQALPPGQPAYVFTVERGGGGSTAALEARVLELIDQDELLSTSAPALATLDVSRPAAVKLAKAAAHLEEAGGTLDRADDEMMSFWKLVFTNDAAFLSGGGASGLGSLPDCYLAAHWLCNCTCESLTGTRARANKYSHTQLHSRAPPQAVLSGQGSPRADGANQCTFMRLPSRVCETECGGGVCARLRVRVRVLDACKSILPEMSTYAHAHHERAG